MAGTFGDVIETGLLNHLFMKTAFTQYTRLDIALSTADPGDDGSGIAEPVGNNYSRKQTLAADWNAAASGSITHGATFTFPTASGSWGAIAYWALYSQTGVFVLSGAVAVTKTILTGDTPQFDPGALVISLD